MPDPLLLWRNPQTGFRRRLPLSKIRNAIAAKAEQKLNRLKPKSSPFIAVIDPTNACQLHCPLCPTGQGSEGRKKGMMKLDTVDRILKELGHTIIDAELDNWGEPFLNPDLYAIIAAFKNYKIHTAASTNLSFKEQLDPQELVNCGLDHLIVSTDAARPKTYQKYRVGGDFELVLENIKKVVETRKKRGSLRPFITMKFLVFPHNLAEQDEFNKLAHDLGADRVQFQAPYFPEKMIERLYQKITPEQIEKFARPKPKRRNCHWLWTGVAISWDGGVSPCCFGISYHSQFDFGNICSQSFREIWTSDIYQQARSVFLGKEPKDSRARFCFSCTHRGG